MVDAPTMVIFLLVFLGSVIFSASPILFVIVSAVAGIFVRVVLKVGEKGGEKK